jgi:hypothetical protein
MTSISVPGTGTLAAALKTRTDVSQILGIDIDLILGPVVGTEGHAARQAREGALADMVDTGFVSYETVSSRATAVTEQLREIGELELAAGLIALDLGALGAVA